MADLDFDELDRAVNSLMKDAGATPVGEQKKETTSRRGIDAVSLQSSPMPSLRPSAATTAPEASNEVHLNAAEIRVTEERALTPAVRRTSGRFMDVVHPSSDMRRAAVNSGALQTPPRTDASVPHQGVSVAPMAENTTVDTPTDITSETIGFFEEHELMKEPDHEIARQKDVEPQHDWPDPIDAHEAMVSPFLPEANKVEKRPLGSFGEKNTEPTDVISTEVKHTDFEDEPDDETNDAIALLESSQAKEATELSMDDWAQIDEKTIDLAGATPKEEVLFLDEDESPSKQDVSEKIALSTEKKGVESPAFSGATQIPQQYKEQPNSGDQTTGHIFDIEPSHAALRHAPKQHSGWGLFFGIVALVLVIAGLAVAAYVFLLKDTV